MADLSITAASVVAGSGATIDRSHNAGAAITAGQVVYLESSSSTYKLADCNSATAEVRTPAGIALNGAASGQPLAVCTKGSVTIGATLTAGVAYYLSGTAGGIRPVADNTTGDYPALIGMASSTTALVVNIQAPGAVL
jgi:hypothetical protein